MSWRKNYAVVLFGQSIHENIHHRFCSDIQASKDHWNLHTSCCYLDIDLELMAKLVCHQPASVEADVPVNTSSFRNGTVCQVSW